MDEISYPEYLDNPPPNHNPLIGFSREDTLANVMDSLAILQHLFAFHADNEVVFNGEEASGVACVISCLLQALRFEVNNRGKPHPENSGSGTGTPREG